MHTPLKTVKLQKPETTGHSLAGILYKCDIGVIPDEQVQSYKLQARATARRRRVSNEIISEGGAFYLVPMVATVFLAIGAYVIDLLWIRIGQGILAIIFGILSYSLLKDMKSIVLRIEWVSSVLTPDVARRSQMPKTLGPTMALIYKELPNVRFEIEELMGDPDPFLKVSYENQSYYIAHWGEPDFVER